MTIESQRRFAKGVDDLTEYYAREFDMTYAEMIGCLHMKILDLYNECLYIREGDEDDDDIEERD